MRTKDATSKTILPTALTALLLSSCAAFACSHHGYHHVAQRHADYRADQPVGYGPYAQAPQVMAAYHDPYGTYDVEPPPVTDQ